jgi:hypothetical protein
LVVAGGNELRSGHRKRTQAASAIQLQIFG